MPCVWPAVKKDFGILQIVRGASPPIRIGDWGLPWRPPRLVANRSLIAPFQVSKPTTVTSRSRAPVKALVHSHRARPHSLHSLRHIRYRLRIWPRREARSTASHRHSDLTSLPSHLDFTIHHSTELVARRNNRCHRTRRQLQKNTSAQNALRHLSGLLLSAASPLPFSGQ